MGIIETTITGIYAGFCSGIGSYFAIKYAIKHLDEKEGRIRAFYKKIFGAVK